MDENTILEGQEAIEGMETEYERDAEGIVVNCKKLNVREHPDQSSAVVTVVSANAELMIDLDMSTEEWYFVCTATGICGYSMKQYIEIQP